MMPEQSQHTPLYDLCAELCRLEDDPAFWTSEAQAGDPSACRVELEERLRRLLQGEDEPEDAFLQYVHAEHMRANHKHAPLNSAHEAYAVLLEELDEFKFEVWKKRSQRNRQNMAEELIQVAAMCKRAFYDLELNTNYIPEDEE